MSGTEVQLAQSVAAVLAIVALLLTGSTFLLLTLSRFGSARWRVLRDHAGRASLWLAFAVSAAATAGSLYFSERVGYTPCELCWFQRITMYPLTAVTLIGALRRDPNARFYVLALAVPGLGVSVWHTLIERFPSLAGTSSCSAQVPCTVPWFTEFGFTLASMAGSGFLTLSALALLCNNRKESPSE